MELLSDNLHVWLDEAGDDELDGLPFGVIGLDADGRVARYSNYEAVMAGLATAEVLGRHFFDEIGRCMSNGMVAKRLDDALARGETLDTTIDYVFALRDQITPVKLRMLSTPDSPLRYLLVQRLSGARDGR